MITISLCMIVKDEESTISNCLDSVGDAADEIIIVDTGSKDRTKETSAKYTDKIYDFQWVNDFSAARNFSYSKAEMDYIMWLDADDVLLPKDAAKLIELKETLSPEVDAVMMKYNTGFDAEGNATFSFFRERLSKRSRGFKWKEPVHEYLETGGIILNSDICITHTKKNSKKQTRNIEIYENLLNAGNKLTPRGTYYYARELMEHGRYKEAIVWFSLFLDSEKGWIEDIITACGNLAKCYFAQKKTKEAVAALLRSFSYDAPRAETCCQIGYYFMERKDYNVAAFWFETALKLERPKNNWGFCHNDYLGYVPCIELAVCYDKLGEYEKAEAYNEMAFEHKPSSAAVSFNKLYFMSRLSKS